MLKLFSKKPTGPKITSQDKAILDLKVQRDKLKQYQKKVGGEAANRTVYAKLG